MAEQMNNLPYQPNQDVFAKTLERLAAAERNIIAVTSDSRGSGKLGPFAQQFPEQLVEVGIAEQNLVGVAAGLASCGKKVFAVSPACFLTARSLEQIKNDIAYSDNAVTVVGISAGVSYGALGSTHHSLHDFAVLRAIHNITIVAPADNYETAKAVELAAASASPVYLRFGKKPMPNLLEAGSSEESLAGFSFGKGRVIRKGKDAAIIANGEAVAPAIEAALKLQQEGLEITVVSMHTIKPLDKDLLNLLAAECRCMVTVEEHSVHGGLGEACAAHLLQQGMAKPFKIMGIPDEYTVTGSQMDIFRHYGITAEGISNTVLSLLNSAHA